MMHGDAHPGNFMLLDDGRMAVIDFGAVAPLPEGLPVADASLVEPFAVCWHGLRKVAAKPGERRGRDRPPASCPTYGASSPWSNC